MSTTIVDPRQVIVVYMNQQELECGMCGIDYNNAHIDDRNAVPFYNGAPITSNASCDGYREVCKACYERWNKWDVQIALQEHV